MVFLNLEWVCLIMDWPRLEWLGTFCHIITGPTR